MIVMLYPHNFKRIFQSWRLFGWSTLKNKNMLIAVIWKWNHACLEARNYCFSFEVQRTKWIYSGIFSGSAKEKNEVRLAKQRISNVHQCKRRGTEGNSWGKWKEGTVNFEKVNIKSGIIITTNSLKDHCTNIQFPLLRLLHFSWHVEAGPVWHRTLLTWWGILAQSERVLILFDELDY